MKTQQDPSTAETPAAVETCRCLPDGAVPLDFATEQDEATDAWQRALNCSFHIKEGARPDLFVLVTDPDRIAGVVNCSVADNSGDGDFWGWCSCEAFAPQDAPCRHLNALRQRAELGIVSISTVTEA